MDKKRTAKDLALIGMAAASLTAVKLALSWLANVELVTLFVVFYTLVLGRNRTLFACNVFIVVECLIYGFAPWVISYFIHWNFLVILTWFLDKKGVKKAIIFALFVTGLTVLFGVQTTIIELLFYSSETSFLQAFGIKYFMGLSFFITHILSSFISITLLLPVLRKIPVFQEKNQNTPV